MVILAEKINLSGICEQGYDVKGYYEQDSLVCCGLQVD
jgi:hypothetical protein